jgi:hypothetical protein
MPIQKLNTSRNVATRSTYVGEKGRLFYDEAVGTLYISDGVTPGGRILPGSPSTYLANGSYQATLDSSGNLTVPGNLIVQGTTTTVNTETATNLALSGTLSVAGATTLSTATITGAGQNLLLYSENFVAGWTSSNSTTVTANATTNPLTGTTSASKLVPPNGATGRKSINIYVNVLSGIKYTYSIYLKAAEYTTASIWWDSTTFVESAYPGSGNLINLTNGTITGSPVYTTVTSVGNGWYRCSVTATSSATASIAVQVGVGATNGGDITANGTSGIYIYGAQVEVSSTPGVYTLTNGSTVYNAPSISFNGEDVIQLNQTGKLQISALGTNGQVMFPSGSVAFPSITFTNATNRGIYDSNDGGIGFIGVGWEQARIGTTVGTVNYLSLNGGPTTVGPTLTVGGSDSNTDLNLLAKGTNAVNIRSVTSNLFTTTNIFGSGWGTGSATITSTSVVTDPLGGLTAYKLVANVGADPASQSSQQLSGAVLNSILPINVLMTYSIYAKAAEFNQLRIRNNATGEQYTFTLGTTPTATSGVLNPQSTLITNGWYRISWSYVTGGIGSTVYSRGDNWSLRLASTGDGTSGIYLWGPQLEYGSILNPYTANTTTSPVYYTPKITFNNQSGGIGYSVNGGLYLTPWGIGGLSAQAYDSTATGGNQRGVRTVDWQMSRSAATQVAASDYSVIGGGQNNLITSSSGASVIAGGANNSISFWQNFIGGGFANSIGGQWSSITGGNSNTINGYLNFIGTGYSNYANDQTAVTTVTTTIAGTNTTTIYITAANPSVRTGLYIPINGGVNWVTAAVTTTTVTITGGAISGTTFTFTSSVGTVVAGMVLTGSGVTANTYIVSGSGLSWTVNNSQTSTITTATSYTIGVAVAVSPSANYSIACLLANSVVVGGTLNQATGPFSFIGNGGDGTSAGKNVAAGDWAVIVGGKFNTITAGGNATFIGAGTSNAAGGYFTGIVAGTGNNATSNYGFIGAGANNNISGLGDAYSAIVGGQANLAKGYFNFIGGGYGNSGTSITAVTTQTGSTNGTTTVTLDAVNASILIGQLVTGTNIQAFPKTYVANISGTTLTLNQNATGTGSGITFNFFNSHGTVVGGGYNQATGSHSFVGGGGEAGVSAYGNVASGGYSVVVGGKAGLASGTGAFVGGGGVGANQLAYQNLASGTSAVVVGGIQNQATGYLAMVLGGAFNTASASASAVLGGRYGTDRFITGNTVFPASYNPLGGGQGFSQAALLVLAAQTTNNTATVLVSDQNAPGNFNQVALPVNSAYYFKGSVIAGVTGGGASKAWTFDGAIKKGAANSVAFIGTPIVNLIAQDSGASTWSIALSANTTNDTLTITVTGQTSTIIRWVCKIETTEMTF